MYTETQLATARRQARQLRHWYTHVATFVGVVGLLAVINAAQRPGASWWVAWVAGGWGVGVLAHGLRTASPVTVLDDWERRKAEEILRRS